MQCHHLLLKCMWYQNRWDQRYVIDIHMSQGPLWIVSLSGMQCHHLLPVTRKIVVVKSRGHRKSDATSSSFSAVGARRVSPDAASRCLVRNCDLDDRRLTPFRCGRNPRSFFPKIWFFWKKRFSKFEVSVKKKFFVK